jgi:DNA polymerase-3 subunit delta
VIFQNLEDLEGDLKKCGLRSVYVILGPELFQCQSAIRLIKSQAVTPESESFDYSEYAAGDTSIDEMLAAANTFPMMSKRRLVLVSRAEKLKDSEQDMLLMSLENLASRSTVLLFAEELDHRRRFYKALRDNYCTAEFQKLKGAALERWAEHFVRKEGYRISRSSIKKIVELAGSDLQALSSELEKLLLYAADEKRIPDSIINDLVRTSRQHGIFELIEAVGRRERSSALYSLANLVDMGLHPLVIVTMMARHCRQILIAKEYLLQKKPKPEIARAAQIPAFLLEQFLRQAQAADADIVQEMYIRIADIDKRLKSSSGDGRLLLESVICALV